MEPRRFLPSEPVGRDARGVIPQADGLVFNTTRGMPYLSNERALFTSLRIWRSRLSFEPDPGPSPVELGRPVRLVTALRRIKLGIFELDPGKCGSFKHGIAQLGSHEIRPLQAPTDKLCPL